MDGLTLFIGGRADGSRLCVPDGHDRYLSRVSPSQELSRRAEGAVVSRELYRQEWLQCGARRFRVFVVEGMPMEAAVEPLLANYRGGAE